MLKVHNFQKKTLKGEPIEQCDILEKYFILLFQKKTQQRVNTLQEKF